MYSMIYRTVSLVSTVNTVSMVSLVSTVSMVSMVSTVYCFERKTIKCSDRSESLDKLLHF